MHPLNKRRRWEILRMASVGLNLAYLLTFWGCQPALLVQSVALLIHPDRAPNRLSFAGHLSVLMGVTVLGIWLRRQERRLEDLPKSDLVAQMGIVRTLEYHHRLLWECLALAWTVMGAGILRWLI